MRKVAEAEFPLWNPKPVNRTMGRSWKTYRKATRAPIPMRMLWESPEGGVWVTAPHPLRAVEILRTGRRLLDEDALYGAMKPVLDAIRRKVHRREQCTASEPGLLYDDSPAYCKLVVHQQQGDPHIRIRIYEFEPGDPGYRNKAKAKLNRVTSSGK
jgi:hypothetical protein